MSQDGLLKTMIITHLRFIRGIDNGIHTVSDGNRNSCFRCDGQSNAMTMGYEEPTDLERHYPSIEMSMQSQGAMTSSPRHDALMTARTIR